MTQFRTILNITIFGEKSLNKFRIIWPFLSSLCLNRRGTCDIHTLYIFVRDYHATVFALTTIHLTAINHIILAKDELCLHVCSQWQWFRCLSILWLANACLRGDKTRLLDRKRVTLWWWLTLCSGTKKIFGNVKCPKIPQGP